MSKELSQPLLLRRVTKDALGQLHGVLYPTTSSVSTARPGFHSTSGDGSLLYSLTDIVDPDISSSSHFALLAVLSRRDDQNVISVPVPREKLLLESLLKARKTFQSPENAFQGDPNAFRNSFPLQLNRSSVWINPDTTSEAIPMAY